MDQARPGCDWFKNLSNGVGPSFSTTGRHHASDRNDRSHAVYRALSTNGESALACRTSSNSSRRLPPSFWRILVPREITLRNLHRTLQTVMGWTNSHLHQFILQRQKFFDPRHRVGTKVADESRTRLGDLIWTAGARLLYEYDFGDGWQHELLLEEVLLGDESFRQLCVAGDRNCPPEDCGGPHGVAELLEPLQDSTHPEHDDIREWVGDF